eukprot:1149940-Pelagomonas_calceolata.AAC.2
MKAQHGRPWSSVKRESLRKGQTSDSNALQRKVIRSLKGKQERSFLGGVHQERQCRGQDISPRKRSEECCFDCCYKESTVLGQACASYAAAIPQHLILKSECTSVGSSDEEIGASSKRGGRDGSVCVIKTDKDESGLTCQFLDIVCMNGLQVAVLARQERASLRAQHFNSLQHSTLTLDRSQPSPTTPVYPA